MKHVIIGVGAAGITAAATIRNIDQNAEIVMVSKDRHVHSRCMLHKYLSHERDEKKLNFVPDNFFEENQITWMRGCQVISTDTETKIITLDNGDQISFDKLLISTGADSFIPPVGDFRNANNVFGFRNLSDAVAIDQMTEGKENVVIVGSGLVGMDAAYALLERGKKVTVVEMADRILPLQLDETAGEVYKKLFEKAGCRFLLSKKASDTIMNADGNIEKIILDDQTELDTDLIIVAAGVRPAISVAKDSNIEAERAISVNSRMETSCNGIYAAGDVTGLSGIWPNAMKQGEVAAYNMCGIEMLYMDTYCMKNTMNFYGVVTLSLGNGKSEEGDVVIKEVDSKGYRKAIIRNGILESILIQGKVDYVGIYQYLIKNRINIEKYQDRIFKLDYAEFMNVDATGKFFYNI